MRVHAPGRQIRAGHPQVTGGFADFVTGRAGVRYHTSHIMALRGLTWIPI